MAKGGRLDVGEKGWKKQSNNGSVVIGRAGLEVRFEQKMTFEFKKAIWIVPSHDDF